MKFYSFLLSLFICLALSACAPFKPSDKRAAICNELNSQLIFGGSTSDARTSEIENSKRQLALKSYEDNQCDQR
jgi:hypothetical protein